MGVFAVQRVSGRRRSPQIVWVVNHSHLQSEKDLLTTFNETFHVMRPSKMLQFAANTHPV